MDLEQSSIVNIKTIQLTSSGLEISPSAPIHHLIDILDSVLRGIGQVMLQNNSYAGLLFLVGIFYNSILFGLAVVIGTIVSTATAILLNVDRTQIRAGLYGFNGALVTIALLYFLQPEFLTWGYVVVACAFSTICMAALINLLKIFNLPTLTAPFIVTTLFFVLACARFGRLHSTNQLPTAGLPTATTVDGIVTATTVFEGLFNGIAQVFFQGNVITGIIFTIALLISSRIACASALIGSMIGILIAWGMGASESAIHAGAFGFNAVLTAIALWSIFFRLNSVAVIYGLLAIIATTVTFATISAALQPIGMPALTAPFVITVWIFILASPIFPKLERL